MKESSKPSSELAGLWFVKKEAIFAYKSTPQKKL
jgi:hypothetical protein